MLQFSRAGFPDGGSIFRASRCDVQGVGELLHVSGSDSHDFRVKCLVLPDMASKTVVVRLKVPIQNHRNKGISATFLQF